MDKKDVVHTCNGILLSHKKEWTNAICSNTDRPRDSHTKRSKPMEKDIIWYHLYVESKNKYKRTYRQNRNIPTDTENKFTKGERWIGETK